MKRAGRSDGRVIGRQWLLRGTLGMLVLGAGYLYAVRGPALLLDLAAAGGMFCF
jgi:hypothetical protein